MSSTRSVLEEVIETGEEEGGSIEFKESLSKTIHLSDDKRNSLVAQLRHRVLSGDGTATYVVGVTDDGDIKGLKQSEFEETVDVLSLLSQEANAHISDTETVYISDAEEPRLVGMVTVQDGQKTPEDTNHLVVGTAGHVDHGKSTLIGTLVTGTTDDGDGAMRSYLDVQPHEVERGLSADLSYAVYGFTEDSEPLRLDNPTRNQERSDIVAEASRLVSFVDTVGHEPWLRTTIRGLVGQRLDYGLLVVSATDGVTKTTREHLGVMLAMNLPVIVTITKSDLVEEDQLQKVELQLEKLLRTTNCNALLGTRYSNEDIISELSDSVVPIIRTSAVTGDGMDRLDELFANLPKTQEEDNDGDFEMYIDKTYVVEGVGTVVSGTVKAGTIQEGDKVVLGPTASGDYINTKARSIEIHYHRVDEAKSGQLISVALQNVKADQVERGMVLAESPKPSVREFEADVMILNHPTKVSTGYEPVIHLETISETVSLDPDGTLLPGDTGQTGVRFKFGSYAIEEGQRFVFREGSSKGVGTVTNITKIAD